jgi:hypothetical protein
MKFSIDRGKGEELIDVGPAAIVEWETENRTKVSRLTDGIGVGDMTDLVFRQLKISGDQGVSDLDSFRKSLLDIDPRIGTDPS